MATYIEGNHLKLEHGEMVQLEKLLDKTRHDITGCILWLGDSEKTYHQVNGTMVEREVPKDVTYYAGNRAKQAAPAKVAVAAAGGVLYNGAVKWVRGGAVCGNSLCVNPEHAEVVDAPAHYKSRLRSMNPTTFTQKTGSVRVGASPEAKSQRVQVQQVQQAELVHVLALVAKQQEQIEQLLTKLNAKP